MENLMQNVETLFANMENFTQKEGLIGKPVTHSNKTFLPVISVTLGYGGGDSHTKSPTAQTNVAGANKSMGGGALGLGARVSTDAILVIDNNNVLIAPIGSQSSISQIIDKVPQIVNNMTSSNQQQNKQQQPQNRF